MKKNKILNVKNKNKFKKSIIALAILSANTIPVLAANEVNDEIKNVEVIQITSSRIKSRPGYDAPTPTTIIGPSFMNDMASVNVADALNRLPSMGAATSPQTSANDVGGGAQGANFLNLRGLGSNRTLVLLDGRRVVGATTTGQVDINMIPSTLLKRTEVVSGGASAAWGADAVAGVVNFVLDKNFTGIKGSIQGGQSGYNDADELQASIAGGFEFDSGRGHVIGSIAYTSADGVDQADSRDWFRSTKLVNNPDYVEGNGEAKRLVLDNVGNYIGSDAGHTFLSAGPLAGITFGSDGSLQEFDFGTRFPGGPLGTSYTGDGKLNDFSARTQILAEYVQVNSFLRGSYEITDNINIYGEFMHGATEGESLSVPYYRFAGAVSISRDNPYLNPELAAQMDSFGMTSLPLGRSNIDFGRANPYNDREVSRFLIGSEIEINDNWSLDAYYQRGISKITNEVRSDVNTAKYDLAVDAVLDGSGNIVCRSTLTDPANGCVPANLFGLGAPSDEAVAYVVGTAYQNTKITQDVLSLTFSGDLYELDAGMISSSFGYEYRKEKFTGNADPISEVSGWWVGNYKDAGGEYDVNEVFAEVLIPIFFDSPMGESLDLNAAIRFTDYSTSGQVTTWKTGLTYNIGAGVSLRGTQSRDIRAPNLNEYYSGGRTDSNFFDDPFVEGTPNYLVTLTIQGNPELAPEEADTTTIGLVYQPEFLEGLEFSIDYFQIAVDGAIDNVEDQDIVDRCYSGEESFCSLIERDPSTGLMTNVFSKPVNLTKEKLRAFDFEISYDFDLADGNVFARSIWTHTTEHFTEDRGIRDDLLGEFSEGNGPQEWAGLTSVRFTNEDFTISLRHRHIGEGVIDAEWTSGIDVDNNKVDAVNYIDFTASMTFEVNNANLEVFASVDNLFDKEPPRVGFDGGTALDDLGVSNARHDLIGRYFRAGVRFEF